MTKRPSEAMEAAVRLIARVFPGTRIWWEGKWRLIRTTIAHP